MKVGKKMTKKVYCKDCRCYTQVSPGRIPGTSATDGCSHSKQISTFRIYETAIEPEHVIISSYGWVSEINANNDCKYYDEE